ncbi:MAG: D-glycero-beta-D-manno-heptose-7-phosphate kinase [Aquificae bacterium]|nr:D-glycero-beta-D-manno-heptose-7-phosphate kinase [Aquificota bacterium]
MLSFERVSELLERLKRLKVAVVGDLILDSYLFGKVERISPEAPVPVLEVEREEFRLGGAGNVAKNLSALGVETVLVALAGKDEGGERLKELLERNGVEAFLVSDDRPTTRKTRLVSRSQQLLRVDWEDRRPLRGEALKEVLNFLEALKVDGVVVSDYAKGFVTPELVEAVKRKGVFWAVDPRPKNKELYRGAWLVTPNEKELREMAGDGPVEETGRRLKEELSLRTLVVTRGEKGMTLFLDGGVKHFPARARKVYDVTGAGDTVIATLTAFKLAGASWEEACELANLCAGIVVGELGTASVSPEQLLEELRLYSSAAKSTTH